MIQNDKELKATQERIAFFYQVLADLRVTTSPKQFELMASGYSEEIKKMQVEILEYLTRHASEPLPAEEAA
jgi:hypothetical protein